MKERFNRIKITKGNTDYLIKIWKDRKRNISYGYVTSYFDIDWSESVTSKSYYDVFNTLKRWIDNRASHWDIHIKNCEIEKLKAKE